MAVQEVSFGLLESDVVPFSASQREAIEMQVCVSIADEGGWLYYNYKYPRFHNFYGYAQIMSGVFVVKTVPIEYINQELLFWEDDSFVINSTLLCAIAQTDRLINENVTIETHVIKKRQRFTAIRFRFLPGIKANVLLKYKLGAPLCGNFVDSPPDEQSQPPEPKNHSYTPSDRPSSQTSDPADPSVNDGNWDGSNPDKQPPYAEIIPLPGEWHEHVSFTDGTITNGAMGDRDSTSIYTTGGVCHEGVDGRTDPNGKSGKSVFKNGSFAYCAQNPAHGAVTGVTFEFVLDATP